MRHGAGLSPEEQSGGFPIVDCLTPTYHPLLCSSGPWILRVNSSPFFLRPVSGEGWGRGDRVLNEVTSSLEQTDHCPGCGGGAKCFQTMVHLISSSPGQPSPPPGVQGSGADVRPHGSHNVKVAQSCPTLSDLLDCIVHRILQARILGTEMGSLSLLQGIFPTQGSNPGLLHCRRILYQLSHQGSPYLVRSMVIRKMICEQVRCAAFLRHERVV